MAAVVVYQSTEDQRLGTAACSPEISARSALVGGFSPQEDLEEEGGMGDLTMVSEGSAILSGHDKQRQWQMSCYRHGGS
jgi:hypothetical protein